MIVHWRFALALMLGASACHHDGRAWRAQLAAARTDRMVGVWLVELRMPADARGSATRGARGLIAFTLNTEGLRATGLSAAPMLFGTYDIDLTPLALGAGADAGVPSVDANIRGDSVEIRLAPDSKLPIILRGSFRGEAIVGAWIAAQRSGAAGNGEFLLSRR